MFLHSVGNICKIKRETGYADYTTVNTIFQGVKMYERRKKIGR